MGLAGGLRPPSLFLLLPRIVLPCWAYRPQSTSPVFGGLLLYFMCSAYIRSGVTSPLSSYLPYLFPSHLVFLFSSVDFNWGFVLVARWKCIADAQEMMEVAGPEFCGQLGSKEK